MAASRGGAASRAWENRMSTELRIAIIGGGIGGLAVAAALRSSGHEIAPSARPPPGRRRSISLTPKGSVVRRRAEPLSRR
jgi:2-polyprenyl-6-methoxyphenol hydroxylase-like FAD-dependent oxidoreductase